MSLDAATAWLTVRSLRRTLLLVVVLPVLVLVAINTFSLYKQALAAANLAYDRTLLASAKTIGEQLTVTGYGAQARLSATVPYSALEAFEADNQSRMVYRVSAPDGRLVSGFADLAPWHGEMPVRPAYAALVDFYDDVYQQHPVRVAVLLQPVVSTDGSAMAQIQVAETLELRQARAREILQRTLWRQGLLVLVIAIVVVWGVQRATEPVRALSRELRARAPNDLRPVEAAGAPQELRPVVRATNAVMARLARMLNHQRRFVRDTAHQLRTPLAVLKTQVQSARRGDVAPEQALAEIEHTVDRATQLANQMLSLAKVEQVVAEAALQPVPWHDIARGVALDLSPLAAAEDIDFSVALAPVWVIGHEWMLRELTRNLLHNAIKHSPRHAALSLRLTADQGQACLHIDDEGPGLSEAQRTHLFEAFAASGSKAGAGLGLLIAHDIVHALGGRLALINREDAQERVVGLRAQVLLSAVPPPT